MQRFLMPTLAAAVIVAGAWLAPQPAAAQSSGQNRSYDQHGATAWGDPWLNENDFDYNRRHWLPSHNGRNWQRSEDNYGENNGRPGYGQNWRGNQGYDEYGNNYGPNQGDYGQYGGQSYNRQPGYGRNGPMSGPRYYDNNEGD